MQLPPQGRMNGHFPTSANQQQPESLANSNLRLNDDRMMLLQLLSLLALLIEQWFSFHILIGGGGLKNREN